MSEEHDNQLLTEIDTKIEEVVLSQLGSLLSAVLQSRT